MTREQAIRETGAWFDIGTPESYLDALAWHLDGNSRVHPDAIVGDVAIGENVHVMAGAEVHDATLERTIVFPGATIGDSSLHNSIVDEQAHIEGVDLAGALVGEYTRLVQQVDKATLTDAAPVPESR